MNRGCNKYTSLQKADGFTLIDMAIALMVLGLLLTPMIKIYEVQELQIRKDNTNNVRDTIDVALDQYYFENGNYPCPADPTIGPGDATYGEALGTRDANGKLDATGASPCAGTAVEMPGGTMMVGAVPFKDLKIPSDTALDGWRHKMTYAITTVLTRTDIPFDPVGGVLSVDSYNQITDPGTNELVCEVDAGGNPVTINLANDAHWVLISHGMAGTGAYTPEGTLIEACPDGVDATTESENCDYLTGDTTFRQETCAFNTRDTLEYYDDIVAFSRTVPARIWANSPQDSQDIFSDITYVGINNEDPTVELDVVGNIRADADGTDPEKTGRAFSQEICDTTGDESGCFDTALIAGDDPAMQCDSSKTSTVMSGMGGKSALCDVSIDIVNGKCASGTYMTGIQADGSPICSTP